MTGSLRRLAEPEPAPWLALASCALAIAAVAVFVAGSTVTFEGSYGEADGKQSVGVNFSIGNTMNPTVVLGTPACFVAGAALAVVALKRAERWRPLGWIGLALNATVGALFAAFLVADYVQGG